MYFCVFEHSGIPQLGGSLHTNPGYLVNLTQAWPTESKPAPSTLLELIERGNQGIETASQILNNTEPTLDVSELTMLPPIERPPKNVFCVGRNYRPHIIEGNIARGIDPNTFPEHIEFFTKAQTAIAAHKADIPLHDGVTAQLDYEAELAIVIGTTGSNIQPDDALAHVFGYTIANDVTARDLQRQHGQWFKGKTLDGSCPLGPWVAHKSAIDNANALEISLSVNGDVRQRDNTSSMIFDVATVITHLSKGLTLEPGDIIATGTPSGVGYAMTPPQFLRDGDQILIEIEKIGRLENTVRAG